MEPVLPIGSRTILWPLDEYQKGDIITFRSDNGKIVTHTLIGFNEDGSFQTKGDANASPDNWSDPITYSDVIGKVVAATAIFSLGFWTSSSGIAIIVILALMMLVYYMPDAPFKRRKQECAPEDVSWDELIDALRS